MVQAAAARTAESEGKDDDAAAGEAGASAAAAEMWASQSAAVTVQLTTLGTQLSTSQEELTSLAAEVAQAKSQLAEGPSRDEYSSLSAAVAETKGGLGEAVRSIADVREALTTAQEELKREHGESLQQQVLKDTEHDKQLGQLHQLAAAMPVAGQGAEAAAAAAVGGSPGGGGGGGGDGCVRAPAAAAAASSAAAAAAVHVNEHIHNHLYGKRINFAQLVLGAKIWRGPRGDSGKQWTTPTFVQPSTSMEDAYLSLFDSSEQNAAEHTIDGSGGRLLGNCWAMEVTKRSFLSHLYVEMMI